MATVTPTQKNYHKVASGLALQTANSHSSPPSSTNRLPFTLFGSCFCPFVQRAWVQLEWQGFKYHYFEVDPYQKPKSLLDVSPRGLVPAVRLNPEGNVDGVLGLKDEKASSIAESTVIMEALEEFSYAAPDKLLESGALRHHLLPPPSNPYLRSVARFQADHVNRHIVPAFYSYLQCQHPQGSSELNQLSETFTNHLLKLIDMIESNDIAVASAETKSEGKEDGPFAGGKELGWVDVMVAPWLFRAHNVLTHYRGWKPPTQNKRYEAWSQAVLNHEALKRTTSDLELYLDSYARYAENRPNTSQVANAINAGKGLP